MKKKTKIISIILPSFLIVGGFFYILKSEPEVITVSSSEDVKNIDSSEINREEADVIKSEVEEKKESNPVDDLTNQDKQIDSEKKQQQQTENNSAIGINKKLVTWGFENSDKREVDTIILHTSYNALGGDKYDLEKVILEYREYGVSPHYVIDREGEINQLVKEKDIAYHAGESQLPDGRTGVNKFSIGIEILNDKEDKFTQKQYQSINKVINNLKNNYDIKYVLGHNQISPGRKTDPWNIDWSKIDK